MNLRGLAAFAVLFATTLSLVSSQASAQNPKNVISGVPSADPVRYPPPPPPPDPIA